MNQLSLPVSGYGVPLATLALDFKNHCIALVHFQKLMKSRAVELSMLASRTESAHS